MANIQAFGGDEALVRVQTLLGDGSLTPEQRQKALSDLETRVIDQAEDKYDQEMQEARDLALSLGWDPDARGGRPELTPSEFIQQYNYDVAVSLGWDPDARGGRPELTPWEYIEQHNEGVDQEARALAESLGWDPDARGGRPELTPWEFIEHRNEEVEASSQSCL